MDGQNGEDVEEDFQFVKHLDSIRLIGLVGQWSVVKW